MAGVYLGTSQICFWKAMAACTDWQRDLHQIEVLSRNRNRYMAGELVLALLICCRPEE